MYVDSMYVLCMLHTCKLHVRVYTVYVKYVTVCAYLWRTCTKVCTFTCMSITCSTRWIHKLLHLTNHTAHIYPNSLTRKFHILSKCKYNQPFLHSSSRQKLSTYLHPQILNCLSLNLVALKLKTMEIQGFVLMQCIIM